MLSVLWLTPHAVWTVTVVTHILALCLLHYYCKSASASCVPRPLGRPTPNVKKFSESSGNFYTNIPRRCGSSRQKNSEKHNSGPDRRRFRIEHFRYSPAQGRSPGFRNERPEDGLLPSISTTEPSSESSIWSTINCLWSSSMWRYIAR